MSAYATCITVYEPNRLMSTVCAFIRFHGASPGNLGSSEVEAFLSSLANNERSGFGLHASSGIGGLAAFCARPDICPLPDRKTGTSRVGVAGGADPG
ncbi:hypothetical protein ECZU28_48970 [Escherichia coli]|nr:hypothetical protein ECZU28_48970 [Escherichia coli]